MKAPIKIFVSGIGTGVGKTICSAVLTEWLEADYWKPVQAGDLMHSDSMQVRSLVNKDRYIHPELHRLALAASPHKAARAEALPLQPECWQLPHTSRSLVVEGAGGLWVPLTDHYFMTDLIVQWQLPVALVARNYLGCINHTLLSLETLRAKRIPLPLFLFNGSFDEDTQRVIKGQLPKGTTVLEIPEIDSINHNCIQQIAGSLTKTLHHEQQK